jgi:hypothetical protein
MKRDQQRPAKAAAERCQGACLDIPPAGACDSLSLTYPPAWVQWLARAGGLWGGFPDPAKLNCAGFAKNGLASSPGRGEPLLRGTMANGRPGGPPRLSTAPNRPTLHLQPHANRIPTAYQPTYPAPLLLSVVPHPAYPAPHPSF